MKLDELIATARDEFDIDIPALQKSHTDSVALSAKVQETLGSTGLLKLSNGETASADDLVGAVAEAGEQIVALSSKVDTLVADGATREATARVKDLVRSGHILPKSEAGQIKLLLSNSELFEELLPSQPLVKLSNPGAEAGVEPVDEAHEKSVEDEILRLSNAYVGTPAK